MSRPALISRVVVVAGAALSFVAAAAPVAAHGPVPPEPPTPANLLLGWTFPPLPTLAILAGLLWWAWAVGRVNGAHPQSRVPRLRTVAFAAAMTALAFALLSGIERYDTTLFSVHMVQHLLLDHGRRAADRACRADHAAPPARFPGDAAAGRAADPPLAGDALHQLPGGGVDRLRGSHVGGAFLAALRRGAREPARPRPRARAVPRSRPAVLVAGRRGRPGAVAPGAPEPFALHIPADAPEHVPGGDHPQRHGPALPALRVARAALARLDGDRPRRPAPRRRDHVGRWRPAVHRGARRGRLGLDAARGGKHGAGGSPRRRGARRDPIPRGGPGRAAGGRRWSGKG